MLRTSDLEIRVFRTHPADVVARQEKLSDACRMESEPSPRRFSLGSQSCSACPCGSHMLLGALLCYHAYCDCVPCSSSRYCCCCCCCCCCWLLLLATAAVTVQVIVSGRECPVRVCRLGSAMPHFRRGGGRGEGDDTNYQLVLRLRLLRLLLLRQLLVLVGKSSCISTSTSSVQHRFPLRFLAFTAAISCLGFGSSNQSLLLGFRVCQLSSPGRVLGLGSTVCL